MRKKPRKEKATPHLQDEDEASTRPFWSGTISFGLVSVPVNLYPATRSSHAGLRMLGPEGQPLSRRYFSSKTGRELSDDEMVNGYEIQKNKFVIVSDEELEKLAPEKSRDIDLKRFVDVSEIPPMYFEHPYFLAPASESLKAYRLLAEVMEKTGQAGLATFVMRGKEYLVAIVAEGGVLRAETMRFRDEIREPADAGLPKPKEPAKATVRKFERLIQRESRKTLSRELLRDEQSERLEHYVEKKKKDHPKEVVRVDVGTAAPKPAEVVDIMSVLKKSLEGSKRRAA